MRLRWHVIAYYLTENGTVDVHRDLEEIAELDDLIEGPTLRIGHVTTEDLTVEAAKQF